MMELFRNSTGYKWLDLYALMNIVQLETFAFCRTYLNWKTDDPCGRQFDQMTQAARSGVKNLTEGSERGATSMQTALKLLDVAKASLCELREDYLTWLMDRNLPPWRQESPESQAVFQVRVDKPNYGTDINHDVAVHIIETRAKFRSWFHVPTGEGRLKIDEGAGVRFANAMLILISRSLNMLKNLMEQRGEEFRKSGGFSERMTAVRVEARQGASQPVDEDAPLCPRCKSPMRVRHGRSGDFWGCTAYPTCRGTREIDSNRQQSVAIDAARQQSAAIGSNR